MTIGRPPTRSLTTRAMRSWEKGYATDSRPTSRPATVSRGGSLPSSGNAPLGVPSSPTRDDFDAPARSGIVEIVRDADQRSDRGEPGRDAHRIAVDEGRQVTAARLDYVHHETEVADLADVEVHPQEELAARFL